MKRLRMVVCLAGSVLATVAQAETGLPAAAAHALVPLAPAQRWVTRVELRSNGYDQRYDSSGDRVGLGAAFDGVAFDATVFPALTALGGGATLGTTALSAEVSLRRLELTLGYGINDDLTVGAIVNAGRVRNRVGFAVAGGNVGWNPAYDPAQVVGPANFPFAPVGGGAAAPMGAADINQILTDPAFGYEYAPLADAETAGPGEAIVGALWRVYQGEDDSLVWGVAARKGLADADDPDNLFDVPLDDGSDDLLTQLEYFRSWRLFDLRALVKRTLQTADEVTLRVPAPGEVLAPLSSTEQLARDLGDFWEYDLELGCRRGDWRTSVTWHRWQKEADRYTSPSGADTAALQADTNIDANQWRLALSWSGINAWRAGTLPLPLIAKLEMQETYAGRNMVAVRDYYLLLTTFF